ncbi:MAG TPA: integration host factor subunit beta [Sutterella sp.]|nr:integration host factor subunit beta [Sutterella sp.]
MTKSELISQLEIADFRLSTREVDDAVDAILLAMTRALASGNRIEIRGFGSFTLNYRAARTGRNPKSGESVTVGEKYVPHFKAGKEMRIRIDTSVDKK